MAAARAAEAAREHAAAEAFALALEGRPAAPPIAPELQAIVDRLRAVPAPATPPMPRPVPRPAAHRNGHPSGRRSVAPATRRWRALITAGLAAAIGATGLGGIALAAHRSNPGDPFYGVKKATEAIQLDLSGGGTDRARTRLGFVATRVRELRAIAHPDAGATAQHRMASLLAQIRDEVGAARTPLLDGEAGDRTALLRAVTGALARLEVLAPQVPATLRTDLQQTVALLRSTAGAAASRLPVPGGRDGGDDPDPPTSPAAPSQPGGSDGASTGSSAPPSPSVPASEGSGLLPDRPGVGGAVPTGAPTAGVTPTAPPPTSVPLLPQELPSVLDPVTGALGGLLGGVLPTGGAGSGR